MVAAPQQAPDAKGKAPVDHLQRFLNALRQSDERHDGDHQSLADYIMAERRDLDTEAFGRLDKDIQTRIMNLAKRCARRSSQRSCYSDAERHELEVRMHGPAATFAVRA